MMQRKGKIIIPAECKPWPHELRAANILAKAGHTVEFIPEHITRRADIYLDGIEYEIKSPETEKNSSLEQTIRTALRQCSNIIIDSSRMKMHDARAKIFLTKKCREQKQIKKMFLITKHGEIIDIFSLI